MGSTAAAAAGAHQQRGGGGIGQRVGSVTAVGSMATAAFATAVLPPRAATVAMKTPVATEMVGAQTAINNQLKANKSRGSNGSSDNDSNDNDNGCKGDGGNHFPAFDLSQTWNFDFSK